MLSFFEDTKTQASIAVGIASLVGAYCFSVGWAALSSLSVSAASALGAYTLLKVADLCISLKRTSEILNTTLNRVNNELVPKLENTISKADKAVEEVTESVSAVKSDMLPAFKQTLEDVRDTANDTKSAVHETSEAVKELCHGNLVIQLGTGASSNGTKKPRKTPSH